MGAPHCIQEELKTIIENWPCFRPFEGRHVNGLDYTYNRGFAIARSEAVRKSIPALMMSPPTFQCPCTYCTDPS